MATKPVKPQKMSEQPKKTAVKASEKPKVTYVYRKDAFNKVKLA
jgi:hypothetical protein